MQKNKLYIANVNYDVTEDQLHGLFAANHNVTETKLIEGKGFGFVTFASDEDAEKALEAFNGQDFQGRALKIDYARPRTTTGGGGGGGYGGGGGGGYGGGGGGGGRPRGNNNFSRR